MTNNTVPSASGPSAPSTPVPLSVPVPVPVPDATTANVAQAAIQQAASASATPSSLAVSAPPPPPSKGSLAIDVRESTDAPVVDQTTGGMKEKISPTVYHHKSQVRWKGKKWEFKLSLPLSKDLKQHSPSEIQELNAAIEKARDIFLQDLQKRDSNVGKEDFDFVLTDTGYVAYVPAENFNPDWTIEENESAHQVQNVIRAEGGSAQSLSQLLQSTKPGKALSKEIDEHPELKKLYESSQKTLTAAPQEKVTSLHPIGINNPNTLCYLNTAVQQWATNPLIRAELLKPGVIKPHKEKDKVHPLYQAMKSYEEAQHSQDRKTLDSLTELRDYLKLSKTSQEDEPEAMTRLHAEIDFSKVSPDSPIYSRSKVQTSTDGKSWDAGKEEEAGMAVRRIMPQKGSSVAELLKAQQAAEHDTKGHSRFLLISPPGVLTVQAQRNHLDPKNPKDTTEIEACDAQGKMQLDGDLYGKPGESSSYELMSFSLHKGDSTQSGHYVTYVKDGERFWQLDDAQVESISSNEFYTQAKLGYVWIYNKESTKVAKPEDSLKDPWILSNSTEHGQTTILAGVGDLTQRADAVIVNYTNETLDKSTPISTAAQIEDEIGKKREAKKGYFGVINKQGLFSPASAVSTTAGALKEVEGIIHVVLPDLEDQKTVKKGVEAALTEAQRRKQSYVAFGLLDAQANETNKAFYDLITAEISTYVQKHHRDIHALKKVEIVLSEEQRAAWASKPAAPTPAKEKGEPVETIQQGLVTFDLQTLPDTTLKQTTSDALKQQIEEQILANRNEEITIDLRGLTGSVKLAEAAQIVHEATGQSPPHSLKINLLLPKGDSQIAEAVKVLKAPLKPFQMQLGNTTLQIETAPTPAKARQKVPLIKEPSFQGTLNHYFTHDAPVWAGIAAGSRMTFDFRGKEKAGVKITENGAEKTYAIDYREFKRVVSDSTAIKPDEVAQAFQAEVSSFLQNHPDSKITFRAILPEEDKGIQDSFQMVPTLLNSSVIDLTRPATYVPIGANLGEYYQLQAKAQLNDADVFIDSYHGIPKANAVTLKEESRLPTDIDRALTQTLAQPEAEEVIFDLRPGAAVAMGLGTLQTHPVINLGDYQNVNSTKALETLLQRMKKLPFMNPENKRIRILLPLEVAQSQRAKINKDLAEIAGQVENLTFDDTLHPLYPQNALILHSAPHDKAGPRKPSTEIANEFVSTSESIEIDLRDYDNPTEALNVFKERFKRFVETDKDTRKVLLTYPAKIDEKIDQLISEVSELSWGDTGEHYENGIGSIDSFTLRSTTIAKPNADTPSTAPKKSEQQLTEELRDILRYCNQQKIPKVILDLRPGESVEEIEEKEEYFCSIDTREYEGDAGSLAFSVLREHKPSSIQAATLMVSETEAKSLVKTLENPPPPPSYIQSAKNALWNGATWLGRKTHLI